MSDEPTGVIAQVVAIVFVTALWAVLAWFAWTLGSWLI